MTTTVSSMDICPINFNLFTEINSITQNIEATLLYAKIKFHLKNSKIKKNFDIAIARTRKEIAEWFGYSVKKIDTLLSLLNKKKLISYQSGMWYGHKKLFISSCVKNNEFIPININLLDKVKKITGSFKSALIYSKIAFAFANTNIIINDKRWCTIKIESLANWSGLSARTVSNIIKELVNLGYIIKEKFNRYNKTQSHYHIPQDIINNIRNAYQTALKNKKQLDSNNDTLKKNKESNNKDNIKNQNIFNINGDKQQKIKSLKKNTEKLNVNLTRIGECSHANYPQAVIHNNDTCYPNCIQQPANLGVSINKVSNNKKTNNNTEQNNSAQNKQTFCDINLIYFEDKLNQRQKNYLFSALNKTIKRYQLKISNTELLKQELVFSIESQQHKNIKSFKHLVLRCMKIIANGQWLTPKGFYKYSEQGRAIHQIQRNREKQWASEKELEKQTNLNKALNPLKNINDKDLTKDAVKIAKKIKEITINQANSTDTRIFDYVKSLIAQLENLLMQGADKAQIEKHLNSF